MARARPGPKPEMGRLGVRSRRHKLFRTKYLASLGMVRRFALCRAKTIRNDNSETIGPLPRQ